MRVKGTAVKVLPEYIKKFHANLYDLWLDALPDESKIIFSNPIFASEWFDLYYAHVVPTQTLAKLIDEPDQTIAWNVGAYSAEVALKGVYSIFLKIASFKMALSRIPQFFATYYDPVFVEVLQNTEGDVKIKFGYTRQNEVLLYYRNAGWIEKFLILAYNPSNVVVDVDVHPDSNEQDLYYAIFSLKWSK